MDSQAYDIRGLRRIAAVIWAAMARDFGRPDELARHGFISRSRHADLASWMRALEHLVRRILLAMALRILSPLDPPRAVSAATAAPRRRFGSRPQLHVLIQPSAPQGRRLRQLASQSTVDRPLRTAALARRLEALRHALRHSGDYARRLARAIARRLQDRTRPSPVVRLQRWRGPKWRGTFASGVMSAYLVAVERHLPGFLEEPG